ncbi:MAG: pirin family protein [Bacteroidia bacterium]|nr:pirin family protein [Bacteroidia bacterium]
MAQREIEAIIAPRTPHFVGDGFRVHNFIPSTISMEHMSPFIMLDYGSKFYFPPSNKPRGVNVHPHRGFETVTIAYKGKVAHHDSAGNSGIIGEGDVQWMTAASGVLHKEYHEETFSKAGGDFQVVQLWVNLPAKDKMSNPKYQELPNDKISKVALDNNAGEVEVIAGNYNNINGSASTFTPIHLLNVKLNYDGNATFQFPTTYNTALLVIEGEIKVNGTNVNTDHLVVFKHNDEAFNIQALNETKVLIMSGEPIHEPIAAHGPFVMNTKAEIIQAFEDFNKGKFGYLEEE